jgi:hypothetical protein
MKDKVKLIAGAYFSIWSARNIAKPEVSKPVVSLYAYPRKEQ